MGYYRYMKAKKNNGKIKFPLEIKGDLELPDLDLSQTYSSSNIKPKISSEVKEVTIIKNKKKKCQSNKLI
jgi:hypothetical protein